MTLHKPLDAPNEGFITTGSVVSCVLVTIASIEHACRANDGVCWSKRCKML